MLSTVIGSRQAGDNHFLSQVLAVHDDPGHDAAGILAPQRLAEFDPLGILDGLQNRYSIEKPIGGLRWVT